MEAFAVDTPGEVDFGSTREDDPGDCGPEAASDDEYRPACHVLADLQEIGLRGLSPWAAWRVHSAARAELEEYRAARAAVDLRAPFADERLKEARSRLHAAALIALSGFFGWSASAGGQP